MAPRKETDRGEEGGWADEARVLGSEFLGTFALTFVAASAIVINAITGQVSYAARVGAPGLLIMGMIYALGEISGAHLNPAVTLAFSVRGVFSWKRVPGYIIFQLSGAVLAALLILLLFGNLQDLGATVPHYGNGTSLVMEAILTLFLVTVVIGTATGHRIVGHNAGLAVGGTVALCGLFAEPVSGASMNPARSLGPALISGKLESIWIYMVGPLAGALLAAGITRLLHGPPTRREETAAEGAIAARGQLREGKIS